jgi:hypothetical protein
MRTLTCPKCGIKNKTNAIYQFMCKKRGGGCGKTVQVRNCEEEKEGNKIG